ncbi:interleukin-17 receptor C isoform X2 [Engystomops pustulosus]|uniref:interleukin-17 receptor C isoform X2 n=1 Tax=Engystomops pustulosus TaxID=76066 RepID=UPI003AFA9F37
MISVLYGGHYSSTERSMDLQCNSSEVLCYPGEAETAEFPVLIPTDIRAKTVKKCDGDACHVWLQVTIDMSVALVSEPSDEFGSDDCDDYYYDDYEDDYDYYPEGDDSTDVNLYIKVNKSSNDSQLCANLYIWQVVPASFMCTLVRVSLPPTSIPRSTNCTKVGSVIYNLNAMPGTDFNITIFTNPSYNKDLHVHHYVPGCLDLDPKENIVECEAPILEMTDHGDNISIQLVEETSARNTTLRVYYDSRYKMNDTRRTALGEQYYILHKSMMVPCLCFQAWYNDLKDAVRSLCCPFKNLSEETNLKKSAFAVTIEGKTLSYKLSAPCNVTGNLSLCWRPDDQSQCHEIPDSRKEILSEEKGIVNLAHLHPSLCLQVAVKGNVLHTYCLHDGGTGPERNEATVLVWKLPQENTFCFVGRSKCITLQDVTGQMRGGAELLNQKIVEDFMTDQCTKIYISNTKDEFYACNMEKYSRSKWNWSRALCLFVIACFVLVLILKNENLKKCLKSVTAEKSNGEIFNERRILILYSPDNQEYENLVHVFASSLKALQLDVVLDQWHRVKMSEMSPVPWYHQEKRLVLEKQGLIILLFSEGAKERYMAWQTQDPARHIDLDPYQTFGAVLNCVLSDFCNRKVDGQYVVATLSPSHVACVPETFKSVPVYELPLRLEKLLKEIAGVRAKKLGHKHVKRLSNEIRDKLSGRNRLDQSGDVAVELQPLV